MIQKNIVMGNPNWQKGGISPNPEGRRKTKYSSRTIKGKIENFLKRNVTVNRLQKMYDGLSEKEKFQFVLELLPYCMPKQQAIQFEKLNDDDLDRLYNSVMAGLKETSTV